MNSSMIGKIEKARRYAEEPDRVQIQQMNIKFQGEHDTYRVSFENGEWSCECHSFSALQLGTCSHIMAIERLLGGMTLAEVAKAGK
ncbi:MAG TPA: SWIM zinc finger family protein [Nitrolancea sp.]|nr:SWIM zinc finger family protein [Nitrolancea sp.]